MKLYKDPDAGMEEAVVMAEEYIPENYKGTYGVTKAFYKDPKAASIQHAENYVAPENRENLRAGIAYAEQAYDNAAYLKEKKDEYQQAMCVKIVETGFSGYDTQNTGYITKAQCEDMTKKALTLAEKGEYYHQGGFDVAFKQIDKSN